MIKTNKSEIFAHPNLGHDAFHVNQEGHLVNAQQAMAQGQAMEDGTEEDWGRGTKLFESGYKGNANELHSS